MPKSAGLSIPRHSWGPAVFSPLSLLSPGAATYFVLLSSHQLRSGLYCQGLSWRNNSDLLQYWPEILACTYILKTAQNWKQSLAHPAPARADFQRSPHYQVAWWHVCWPNSSLFSAKWILQGPRTSSLAHNVHWRTSISVSFLRTRLCNIYKHLTWCPLISLKHLAGCCSTSTQQCFSPQEEQAATEKEASASKRTSSNRSEDPPPLQNHFMHNHFSNMQNLSLDLPPSIKPPGSPLFHGSIATRTAHHHHTITTTSSFYLEAIGTLGWMSYIKLFTELKNTSPHRKRGTGGVGSRTVNIS